MFKKQHIANIIFIIILLYIVSPWFFEKKLLFNELISLIGISILFYKKFKIEKSLITKWFLCILLLGILHSLTSVFRADKIYYYLRNSVILYSMFSFFIGYYLYNYGITFLSKFRSLLNIYIITFLFYPISTFFFERFSMSNFFPSIAKIFNRKLILPILILLNIVYSINYESATTMLLSGIYFFIWICPSYKFFKNIFLIAFFTAAVFFAIAIPFITINPSHYSYYNTIAIYEVINSHPILALDPNSTWRLVIWKQLIVDLFPNNIIGIGFGTPALKYFPIEDIKKLDTLPYVLGGHNSFIYLFARLGILFIVFITLIYNNIFKEYFNYKKYYFHNYSILIFYSFLAVTFIALFNPVLESPIYSSSYWLILGFLAKVISLRQKQQSSSQIENN